MIKRWYVIKYIDDSGRKKQANMLVSSFFVKSEEDALLLARNRVAFLEKTAPSRVSLLYVERL